MKENELVNDFDGYPTFNDVEDKLIRFRNRGHILLNIVEDMTIARQPQEEIWKKIKGYLDSIPEEEIAFSYEAFIVAFNTRN